MGRGGAGEGGAGEGGGAGLGRPVEHGEEHGTRGGEGEARLEKQEKGGGEGGAGGRALYCAAVEYCG